MNNVESLFKNLQISNRLNHINAHRIAEHFYSQIMAAHKASETTEPRHVHNPTRLFKRGNPTVDPFSHF
ncbi:hypothetical protein D3C79_375250 [compost metagenome]